MSHRPQPMSDVLHPRSRLALLTLDFLPRFGGVQQYLFEVSQRLGRRYELIVVTPVGGSLPEDVAFRRISVPTPSLWHFVRHLLALRPHRVLVGHAHPRLLLAAAIVAWGRYSVIAHGNDFMAAQLRWHRLLFNGLLARAHPLIVHSFATAGRLQELGLPTSLVVHPGTDPMRFAPASTPPPPPVSLLTVGRLVPRKGVDTVLKALPDLLIRFPDVRYRIAGDGPDRARLEQMARDVGVAHAVNFLGRVPEEELPQVYRNAHVFVMPVREEQGGASVEGFGIVYLEASASGLPVVAGRSGGAVEAVRQGETGFLVPPNDPQMLVQVLGRLIANSKLRRRMGHMGRRWVEGEMNWDRVAREMLEALEMQK